MMREKSKGLKNGTSKKEKYKALRKMRSAKRAEQQQKVAMKAMPPPLPKKMIARGCYIRAVSS